MLLKQRKASAAPIKTPPSGGVGFCSTQSAALFYELTIQDPRGGLGHKKSLKTEVLKLLMSAFNREAELEILQRHCCR
jgi:hypothetical protein